MPEVHLEKASKIYKTEDKRKQYAVRDLDFTVTQGEFVFLIGSSGAGKTTMLKLIGGEIAPDEGAVYVDNANIARFFGPWRVRLTRTFGIVSQQSLLIRKRTIMENLMVAARASGMQRKSKAAAEKALSLVGLPRVGECFPAQLSIWDIMHLLNELNSRGTTIIMATHASQYVNIMRRRVVTLVDGRLVGDVEHGRYGDIV